jgi:hypothetical protein
VLKEYDIVKICSLRKPSRAYDGTDGIMREPRVGDRGIVVHILSKDNEEMKYIVECVCWLLIGRYAKDGRSRKFIHTK